MAMTVSASIQLNDLMSGPIMHIMSAIDTMCNHLELVDSTIDKGFDTSGIFEVRQQIDLANAELVEMQNKIESVDNATKKVENSTDGWLGKISKIGAGYLSLKGVMEGIKFAVGYSDNLTQNTNRLSLMNDGTQSTESLQQDIYESAMRARASMSDTMSAVASLGQRAGDSFQSNQEIIQFVENLNKQFAIAGATQQEQASATLQLTQALGSGVLRGEELNAVFESAPNVIQTIADYLEVPIGQIKDMASDGEITADIVRNAMLSATSDINEEFNSTRVTWEQTLEMFANKAYMAFKPLGNKINEIANSPTMQVLFENIGNALVPIANALTWIVDKVSAIGGAVVDNWSTIEPILDTAIALTTTYTVALGVNSAAIGLNKLVLAGYGLVAAVHCASLAMQTGATFSATAAQWGFNAALLACPLTWIIIGIIGIIGAIYFATAQINKTTGTAYSATGIICGCISTVWAVIWNVAMAIADLLFGVAGIIINLLKSVGNFLANVFKDPVASVIYLFRDMANTVLSILQSIAASMDKIFGTNQAAAVGNWMQWVDNEAEKLVNKLSPDSDYEKVFNIDTFTSEDFFGVKRLGYYDTYMKGYNWVANLFKSDNEKDEKDEKDDDDKFKFDPSEFKNLINGTDKTAKNTKDIAKNTEKATSLLELVKNNWEKEAIMKYTASAKTITYDLSGMTNTYNNTGEAFDAVKELGMYLNRKMSTSAEGV